MNISQLMYVVEIENTGAITKAAENLFISQPNLSRSIREMEEELGFQIFKRTAKGMIPTHEGEELIVRAKKILTQMEKIEEIGKPRASKRQAFSVSVPRADYISLAFTRLAASLDTERPIEVDYKETNAMRAIDNLLNQNYDLCIIRCQEVYESAFLSLFQEKDLNHEEIASFTHRVLMSKEHPLAGEDNLTLDVLKDYIELIQGDPYVPSLNHVQALQTELTPAVNKRIYVYDRGSRFDLLRGVPGTYTWVSPIPREDLSRYKLVLKPCEQGDRVYKDILVYRKSHRLTDLDRQFINEIKGAWEEVLHQENQ